MKPWSLINPTLELRSLAPCDLLVFTDTKSISIDLELKGGGLMISNALSHDFFKETPELKARATVGELARSALGPKAQVMALPPVIRRKGPVHLLGAAWLLSSLALLAWATGIGVFETIFFGLGGSLIMLPLLLGFGYFMMAKYINMDVIVGADALGVKPSTVHAYALAVSRGELWHGALPAGAPVPPSLHVTRIREEYARLRTDLVYRIENPALFDSAVPTTAAFEQALVDFDDAPEEEREHRATQVEVRFTVAMQHAERVGIRHAEPEHRDELTRAAKVARLAASANSDGERRAALTQLQRILDSLALYYLPSRIDHPELY